MDLKKHNHANQSYSLINMHHLTNIAYNWEHWTVYRYKNIGQNYNTKYNDKIIISINYYSNSYIYQKHVKNLIAKH